MWSVASKSMTHMEEEEIRHLLVLPDSTNVAIKVDADLSDFLIMKRLNSSMFILQLPTTLPILWQ